MVPMTAPRTDSPLATAEFLISVRQNDKAKIVLDLMKPYCRTVEQMDAIGKLYSDLREFKDTLDLAKTIYSKVTTNEQRWTARVNIIRAHLNLNQPLEAMTYIEVNEKLNPNDHPNMMDKAMCLFLLNRKDEGEVVLRNILTQPHTEDIDFRVKFNLGTYDLANGNFKEGLRHVLLDGRKLNIWESFPLPKEQLWEGGPHVPGQKLMVCAEGGIGDEFISIRFMKHLQEAGFNPVWYTSRKDLATIFHRNYFEVVTDLSSFGPDWMWTYSMPVPTYLDLDESDLWKGTYIQKPDGEAFLPIAPPHKKRIGIKCMGNPKYDQDLHRTIPFDQLIDSIPEDYEIYSFHVDEEFTHPRVVSLKPHLKSWDDTLLYLDAMDVVVSSCTSLAHASAILERPTFVIVPILNYYTWAAKGNKSKWYGDSVTVLRQQEYDNWNAPLKELSALL